MSKKDNLDFLIIGAMRSGTTTLHELLKQHPQIALPPGKEVPFFSNNTYYKKGVSWYLSKNFTNASSEQKWGTITPQYMFVHGGAKTEVAAKRIFSSSPNVKLIAMLRNPIDRAYSHYKYAKRHNYEFRDFERAVEELEQNKTLKGITDVKSSYLARSLYGQQLEPYFKFFSDEQILVLFTDELETKPEDVLEKIYRFIGVDHTFTAEDIGKVFHKGGAKAKVELFTPGGMGRFRVIRLLWRSLVPYSLRKRFEIWLHVWNIKPDNTALDQMSETYKKLVDYFANDVKKLEDLTQQKTPWQEW